MSLASEGLFSRRVVEGKHGACTPSCLPSALAVGWAFLGKQSGMAGGPQLGAKEMWISLEAPRHKVFNIIFERGIYPLEKSWMTWPLAQSPEDISSGKGVCAPPLSGRAAPDRSEAAGDSGSGLYNMQVHHCSGLCLVSSPASGSVFQACKSWCSSVSREQRVSLLPWVSGSSHWTSFPGISGSRLPGLPE